VSSDAGGNFVVVWVDRYTYYVTSVSARRFTSSGAPNGEQFQVSTYTTAHESAPEVSADADGDFVVVWQESSGEVSHVKGKRFTSAGVEQFELVDRPFTSEPAVGSQSNGDFVVVWRDFYAGYATVFGQRYDSAGNTLGTEFQVNSYTDPRSQSNPAVAVDADGAFVVVWENLRPSASNYIVGQRFASSGDAVGERFQISDYTTGSFESEPRVSSDPSGNFVVVWDEVVPDVTDYVHAHGFANDGQEAFPDTTIAEGGVPDVVVTGDGTFVITWSDVYGNIAGERFDSAGSALGSEFTVNAYTTSSQFASRVAADPSGHFVVVWQSDTQDGNVYGVFGRRLGSDGGSSF
jgi:hypothetical protein